MLHKGESREDYLEKILILSQSLPAVRSIDIVRELGYSKPSVSVAMKNLRQSGEVTMDEDGYIRLTDSGRAIAERVYERHITLEKLLSALGVSSDVASVDACKIEHVISEETFVALKKHMLEYAPE